MNNVNHTSRGQSSISWSNVPVLYGVIRIRRYTEIKLEIVFLFVSPTHKHLLESNVTAQLMLDVRKLSLANIDFNLLWHGGIMATLNWVNKFLTSVLPVGLTFRWQIPLSVVDFRMINHIYEKMIKFDNFELQTNYAIGILKNKKYQL